MQPIMRRRQWRVVRLVEFFPRNGHLLGLCVNGGNGEKASEIKLRLRHAHAPGGWAAWEHAPAGGAPGGQMVGI